jgi:hypothetical protein
VDDCIEIAEPVGLFGDGFCLRDTRKITDHDVLGAGDRLRQLTARTECRRADSWEERRSALASSKVAPEPLGDRHGQVHARQATSWPAMAPAAPAAVSRPRFGHPKVLVGSRRKIAHSRPSLSACDRLSSCRRRLSATVRIRLSPIALADASEHRFCRLTPATTAEDRIRPCKSSPALWIPGASATTLTSSTLHLRR